MELLGFNESEIMVNGKPKKFGIWHSDIAMNKDEKIKVAKILLKEDFYGSIIVYDEPGETEFLDSDSPEDIEKAKDDYDEMKFRKVDGKEEVTVTIYADYISGAAIVSGTKSGVERVLNMLGLKSR